MRQREEQELTAEVRRELEALDRALAGEPVDAEFDAAATLARELRASRPEAPAAFTERLDERAAAGFPPEQVSPSRFAVRVREWLAGVRLMRLLAPAGAVATIVLVASVAVIQSGGGGGNATTAVEPPVAQEEATDDAAGEAAPALPQAGGAGGTAGEGADSFSDPVPPPIQERERVAPGEEREVERSAALSLSADGDEFETVTDGVVEIADRYKGFVISSEESAFGDSSRATFELEIPSDRLQEALADLSELAHVEARSEDALDITAPTVTARQRLTDARTEVDSLLRQLAEADTPKETEDIRFRLDIARADVAAAKEEFQKLARRANYADVRVTVTSGGGGGDWGADDALDDIGDALSTAAGVALISAAILLPIALFVTIIALAWRATVRRGRERALDE